MPTASKFTINCVCVQCMLKHGRYLHLYSCHAKSASLGLSDSKVVASEFRLLSCAIMRGMASMILNRDIYCDDINDDQSLND